MVTCRANTNNAACWLLLLCGCLRAAGAQEVAVLPPRQATPATAGFTAAATNAAAAAAAVQGGGGLDASVIDGTLQLHNSYRALHAAPALSWSGALAAQAAGWASACSFAHDPDNYEAGENVFACNWLEEPADILRAAVTVWYSETADYDFSRPEFSTTTGHFTQLVWRATTLLGCTVQQCGGGIGGLVKWKQGTLAVCRYLEAGNWGSYVDNVRPPCNSSCAEPPRLSPSPSPSPSPSIRRDPPLVSPTPVKPPPKDCVGAWSSWSSCSMPCGGGLQSAVFSVAAAAKHSGAACEAADGEARTRACNAQPCAPASLVIAGPGIRALQSPACRRSANGKHRVCMRSDGRLALYANATAAPLWRSNTTRPAAKPFKLLLAASGDVSVRDSSNQRVWHTGTHRPAGSTAPCLLLLWEDSGNLAVVCKATTIWQAGGAGSRNACLALNVSDAAAVGHHHVFVTGWHGAPPLGGMKRPGREEGERAQPSPARAHHEQPQHLIVLLCLRPSLSLSSIPCMCRSSTHALQQRIS